ncbi:MAG TPA: hypothetical protein H9736_02940 [Candidatus Anaerotruncus excrementipullorum]|uniref:FecR protein domain-containing protein n=1 Tax=Candidatus Anaerotruncus excrementipullorum TaxID=2838465 RepID=A0A9D1WQ58_9FIRM|nr:hypothetical protein [Candidatus Anaerotruncus excrementipullorum]
MKKQLRRAVSLCLTLAVILTLGVLASAASPYSVKAAAKSISFIQNGYVTGTYAAKNNNITLMKDSAGDLLVCFYTSQGKYVGVTLGSQSSLTLSGSIGTLTIDRSFSGAVTLAGSVSTLKVNSGSTVTVASGGSVGTATLSSTSAKLKVSSGGKVTTATAKNKSQVTVSGTGRVTTFKVGGKTTSVGSSGGSSTSAKKSTPKMTTKVISAKYGDTLEELESKLKSSVKAYDRSTNRSISGTVSWVADEDTEVTRKSTYKYRFDPADDDKYYSVTGSVKIEVSGSSSSSSGKLTVETETLYASSGDRLRDLEDELEDCVTVTDRYGDEVDGSLEWVSSGSTKVKNNTSYKFEFEPDDDDYSKITGYVKIRFGSGSSSGRLRYTTSTIQADSGDTLRELEDELEDSVRVYDRDDGDRVYGDFEWVRSRSTKVTKDGTYEFEFDPDNSRYDAFTGEIKIEVDGSGEITFRTSTLTAHEGDTLRDLEDQLEDKVRAYDEDGDRLDGDFEWVSSRSTKVKDGRSYKFEFDPDDRDLDTATGTVEVEIEDDYSYELEIDDIEVEDDDHTLRELRSALRRAVTAYDEDTGDEIDGDLEWRDSDSTRVRRSGYYEFVFEPDSSRYEDTRDEIYIHVD